MDDASTESVTLTHRRSEKTTTRAKEKEKWFLSFVVAVCGRHNMRSRLQYYNFHACSSWKSSHDHSIRMCLDISTDFFFFVRFVIRLIRFIWMTAFTRELKCVNNFYSFLFSLSLSLSLSASAFHLLVEWPNRKKRWIYRGYLKQFGIYNV